MIRIADTVKKMIESREGMRIRNRLAFELDKSYATIERWLAVDDEMLTTARAMKILREETGLTDSEILVQDTAA